MPHKLCASRLYRSLKKDVCKINSLAWPEIGKQLIKAYDHGALIYTKEGRLSYAVLFGSTIQGYDYWYKIAHDYQGFYNENFERH